MLKLFKKHKEFKKKVYFCPYCNNEVEKETLFCFKCGKPSECKISNII